MAIKSALGRQLGTQFDSVFDVIKSNPIYDKSGGKIPTLDLNFAKSKSLFDGRSAKNKITFSRSSSATYVGADGLIKTTPVNLLSYSQQLDHSSWSGFRRSVTVNALTAPDGTQTSNLVASTESNVNGAAIVKSFSETATTYTLSVFAKAGTGSILLLRPTNSSVFGQRAEAWFDLSGGTAGTVGDDGSVFTNASSQIVSQGNGWFRCSLTFTVASAGFAASARLYVVDSNGSLSVSNGTSIYLWGAQLEEGSSATDYIPTTNTISGAPRFDYDFYTGESLGLLIEEARTNKILRSENFSIGTVWVSGNNGSSSLSSVTAPDGVGNMWLIDLSATAGTATAGSRVYHNNLAFDGEVNTFSFYARSVSGTGTFPVAFFNGGNYIKTYIELTETTRRYQISCPAGLATSGNNIFGFTRRGTTHNETLTQAYVWGAQVEEGSFPTSYISTSDSAVTRATDFAEITGADFAKTNLLQYSERFDESVYSIQNNTVVIPNQVIAPDGTLTADFVKFDATNQRIHQAVTGTGTFTLSVYARVASGSTDFRLNCFNGTDGTQDKLITVTDTWQRFSFTTTVTADTQWHPIRLESVPSEVYIWGAQLEEGSVLTDYTPSVETFVSRASSATYVDDTTGLIKTTPVNKLLHSEDFSQNAWIKSSVSSITTGQLAPDNTNTAAKIAFNNVNNWYIYQDTGSVIGQSYIGHIYLKGSANATLGLRKPGSLNHVVGSSGTAELSVTTEWQKFEVITSSADTTTGRFLIDGRTSNGASVPAGFELYIWHPQVEDGTTATPYIKTGSTISGAARFENNELILEEERTNRLPYSDRFDEWSIGSNTTVTANAVVAPDGTLTADRVLMAQASGGSQINQPNVVQSNVEYTASVWAKAVTPGSDNKFKIVIGGRQSDFFTTTGEWQRFTFGGSTGTPGIFQIKNGASNINTSDIYFWGAQLEEGFYATSYIPTSGSAVTRAADVSTSALGVNSFYNQTEGAFFTQTGVGGVNNTTVNTGRVILHNGSNTDGHWLEYRNMLDQLNARTRVGNNPYYGTNSYLTPVNYLNDKLAVSYSATGGAAVMSDTIRTTSLEFTPTITQMNIGGKSTGSNMLNGHIKRLTYFNTRLSDDKLKSITA